MLHVQSGSLALWWKPSTPLCDGVPRLQHGGRTTIYTSPTKFRGLVTETARILRQRSLSAGQDG